MKTKVAIVIIITALLIGLGFMLSSEGNKTAPQTQDVTQNDSQITVNSKVYDFGTIDIFGGKVETEFVLTNSGSQDVTITEGTTSCGCTAAEVSGVSFGMHTKMDRQIMVPAGESETLTVIYDPLAHGPDATGPVQRSVFLKTDSNTTPDLEVRIKARVVKNN